MASPSLPLSLSARVVRLNAGFAQFVDRFQPLFALAIRLYVARVFLLSGLTKTHDWNTTIALFENEYRVPCCRRPPPRLGTATELGLPILLILGLGSRFAALALFAFDIVVVISYPDLSDAGLKDHTLWGALLLVTFFHGPGKWSLDYLFGRRFAAITGIPRV
jgi:putative oxidoreductase